MSSIPSTTASLYSGSQPSKPEHSMTVLDQDSATLRASRLGSFLGEPPSDGNRLAAFATNEPAIASSSGACSLQKESVKDITETDAQASKNRQLTETAADNSQTSSTKAS